MKKILNLIYRIFAFTGLYLVPLLFLFIPHAIPSISTKQILMLNAVLVAWTTFNNFWSVACEGKPLDEIGIGDGLVPETGLRKESAQKRIAMYPKVPPELLSKEPEGIILGKYKNLYVRENLKETLHYCILGAPGSGKTSTIILDTLLANFATRKNIFNVFAIDIKGELNQKSIEAYSENVYVVNPDNRNTCGWDVYYRLRESPSDDKITEAMKEISDGLVVSNNPKDSYFTENAKTALTGLLIYYFKQDESFVDSINKILESDTASLITEIIKDSEPTDLWYKYLAKFNGKTAESVQDIFTQMCTTLSVFSKSNIRFCFRDNYQKASPYDLLKKKSVFLAITEDKLESYKIIMRLLTTQVFRELERRPEDEIDPMLLVIDEFARLGALSGIDGALATLRSRRVNIMLCFQSLAQCDYIYGKDLSRAIMGNMRVKIICECSDAETSRTISDWCGKYRDKKETLNGGKNRHKSYSYEDKPIVEPDDLITLVKKEEEILIVSGSCAYLRPKKCYYFKDPKLKALADKVKAYNKNQSEVNPNER